jgi:hypothetical protein
VFVEYAKAGGADARRCTHSPATARPRPPPPRARRLGDAPPAPAPSAPAALGAAGSSWGNVVTVTSDLRPCLR